MDDGVCVNWGVYNMHVCECVCVYIWRARLSEILRISVKESSALLHDNHGILIYQLHYIKKKKITEDLFLFFYVFYKTTLTSSAQSISIKFTNLLYITI